MSDFDLREIALAFYRARLANDVDALLPFYAEYAVLEYIGMPAEGGVPASSEAETVAQTVRDIVTTWPFEAWEPLDIVAEGRRVAIRAQVTARHAPTGRRWTTQLMDLWHVDGEGRIERMTEFLDTAGMQALFAD